MAPDRSLLEFVWLVRSFAGEKWGQAGFSNRDKTSLDMFGCEMKASTSPNVPSHLAGVSFAVADFNRPRVLSSLVQDWLSKLSKTPSE